MGWYRETGEALFQQKLPLLFLWPLRQSEKLLQVCDAQANPTGKMLNHGRQLTVSHPLLAS